MQKKKLSEIELNTTLIGDCRETLKQLPDGCINACITSPPFYALRDYQEENQIGLEKTPDEYVEELVKVFREVKRVLREDGTLWLNLGDTYSSHKDCKSISQTLSIGTGSEQAHVIDKGRSASRDSKMLKEQGLKNKEDSIYAPNKTKEVERKKGYYAGKWSNPEKGSRHDGSFKAIREKKNKRSVWTVATRPFKDAHFAVFPPDLIEPMVLAGCPEKGIVLDPFMGSGTTGMVAQSLGRSWIGCELNPEYVEMQRKRTSQQSLF